MYINILETYWRDTLTISQFCCKIASFYKKQTSTFRRENLDPFYLKFRAELNEFISSVQRQQKEAHKLLNQNCDGKT